jgi:hypothetical protein
MFICIPCAQHVGIIFTEENHEMHKINREYPTWKKSQFSLIWIIYKYKYILIITEENHERKPMFINIWRYFILVIVAEENQKKFQVNRGSLASILHQALGWKFTPVIHAEENLHTQSYTEAMVTHVWWYFILVLILLSAVVTIYTTSFNLLTLCILPTKCICMFRMVLTINSDCFYLCLPCLGICGRKSPIEIAETAKQGSPHHWQFSEVHIDSRYT